MNTAVAAASLVSATAIAAPSIASTEPQAIDQLARLEHIIELLRTTHIRDGFKLDEAGAERVLQFFRKEVEIGPDHENMEGYDDEWTHAILWVRDHGQSFDWLLIGDPDSMIANAAAGSARGAAAVDPVFEAIERHREAFSVWGATLAEQDRLEGILPRERREWSPSMNNLMPPEDCDDAPEWIANQHADWAHCNDESSTLCKLVSTVPATAAGIAALVRYVREHRDNGNDLESRFSGEYDRETGEAVYVDVSATFLNTLDEAMKNLHA